MSLEHILIGMLREPATGYDLGREFAEGVAHFWFAERSQIYPTLKRLEARGWLKARNAPSERGPRRRVYEATTAGREELRRWLRDGPHIGRERLGYVAQTFFLGELGDYEETLTVVERMQAVWTRRLAEFEFIERAIESDHGASTGLDEEVFHYHAALRMGLHQIRAKLAWCDETIDRLRNRRAAGVAALEEG